MLNYGVHSWLIVWLFFDNQQNAAERTVDHKYLKFSDIYIFHMENYAEHGLMLCVMLRWMWDLRVVLETNQDSNNLCFSLEQWRYCRGVLQNNTLKWTDLCLVPEKTIVYFENNTSLSYII